MEKDLQKKKYLYDAERFADLINGVLCRGKQIIYPDSLTDMDSQTGFFGDSFGNRRKSKGKRQRYRDIVKKAAMGMNFLVIGIENQEEVHYLMPLRCMGYDADEYERQAEKIRKEVRKQKGISKAEFLSGFQKENRLKPCITLVLYYGEQWDGATDIHGLLDFTDIPAELREAVGNYSIYVCEVRKFQDTDVFRTDLKQVFDCIKYSENPEKLQELVMTDSAYTELDEDAYDVIAEYTNTKELMDAKKYAKEGRKVDMCGAIKALIQEGRMEGIEQGIRAMILDNLEEGISPARILEKLTKRFEIDEEKAKEYFQKYSEISI